METQENDSSNGAKTMIDIQKKLKSIEASKKVILAEYLNCERELKRKLKKLLNLRHKSKILKK